MAMRHDMQFIGQSGAFLDALERTSRAALLRRPVLVIGERGTGKELIAERLHRLSQRWDGPLITLNCAALPETLIEAEMFGHEAGAFTGAIKARPGRFEEADGGTLFLDELANLSMAAQERLLRAIEYGEVTRIGASRVVKVDVRVIAATNEDLPSLAHIGRFRPDLLDRLSFEVITLPPLRARTGDVPVLSEYFARRMALEIGWENWPGFTKGAMAKLEAWPWPGNVRELRNVVERAVFRWENDKMAVNEINFDPFDSPWKPLSLAGTMAEGSQSAVPDMVQPARLLTTASAPASAPPASAQVSDLRAAVEAYECALISASLEQHRYNQRQTARALGLSYDQLRHAMKKHNLVAINPAQRQEA